MQKNARKISAVIICIFFLLSIGASIAMVPTTSAHTPRWQFPTVAYISLMPNTIGVGQTITAYIWIDLTFGGAGRSLGETTSYAGVYNNYRFHNYQVVITGPNGTQQTMTFPTISDTTSSQLFYFTPTSVGTYNFNFTFPGQTYNQYPGGYDPTSMLVNDTYLPSTASTNLTVLSNPVAAATTGFPLPTQYWTRPIYGENSNWYSISSDWLGTGNPQFWAENYIHNLYVPDAVGSLTAHIMWTKPLQEGGTVGGNQYPAAQGVGYFEGSAYNNRYTNPIILDGYLYYTAPVAYTGSNSGTTYCVDLRTGQTIWTSNIIPALSFGYIYNLWNYNQHGTFPPILFTANFAQAFDGFTGDPLFNVTGVPTGTSSQGPNGEQLRYVFANDGTASNPQWYLAQWNSSRLWEMFTNPWTGVNVNSPTQYNDSFTNGTTLPASDAMYANVTQPTIGTPAGFCNQPATYNYLIYGNVVNSSSSLYSYDWNISVPWLNVMGNQTEHSLGNGTVIYGTTTGNPDASSPVTVLAAFANDMLLCYNGSLPSIGTSFYATSWTPYTFFAVNLNATKGSIGSILWSQTYNPPAGNVTVLYGGVDPVSRVFYETYKEDMQYVAFSLNTGQKLWGPTQSQTALDYYGNDFGGNLDGQCAYGGLYSVGFAGILYCWNATTGALEWTYGNGGTGNSTFSGFNSPYGDYPTFIAAIGNGVIYTETTEHTVLDPIYKGALTRAINATNGAEIWTLSAFTGGGGSTTSYAIADGYTTYFNGYDNSIYVVGRGTSQATVSATPSVSTLGSYVVIQGTVMDISAGTKQNQQAADFPNGVPVSSDASMKDWMGYVYQQKPEPTNFTGVQVQLYVLDSNGNYRQIGTATTDENGMYSLTWAPDIAGNYTIYAEFAGTNGYWPSNAETHLYTTTATITTPIATAQSNLVNTSDLVTYMAAGVIAIIIAIAIVGVLMLRKRP